MTSRTCSHHLRCRPLPVNHHRDATECVAQHERRDVCSELRVEECARVVPVLGAAAHDEVQDGVPRVAQGHSEDSKQGDGSKQYNSLSPLH